MVLWSGAPGAPRWALLVMFVTATPQELFVLLGQMGPGLVLHSGVSPRAVCGCLWVVSICWHSTDTAVDLAEAKHQDECSG